MPRRARRSRSVSTQRDQRVAASGASCDFFVRITTAASCARARPSRRVQQRHGIARIPIASPTRQVDHDEPNPPTHEMIGGASGRARVGHAHHRQRVEIDAAVGDIGRKKRAAAKGSHAARSPASCASSTRPNAAVSDAASAPPDSSTSRPASSRIVQIGRGGCLLSTRGWGLEAGAQRAESEGAHLPI